MYNEAFDPLKAKYDGTEEVVIKALKREITNILNSYVGWSCVPRAGFVFGFGMVAVWFVSRGSIPWSNSLR